MADSDPAPSPLTTTLSQKAADLPPIGPKISELDVSQADLLNRLQGLKQDVQNWRSHLDTKVKTYTDELSQLKQVLNNELDQLRSDFGELRVTLQKQQEDVTSSLKNLGLQDGSEPSGNAEIQGKDRSVKAEAPPSSDGTEETKTLDGSIAESSLSSDGTEEAKTSDGSIAVSSPQ